MSSVNFRMDVPCCWLLLLTYCAVGTCDDRETAGRAFIESVGGKMAANEQGAIVKVELQNCWLTDADLRTLASLSQLEYLDLSQTKITDRGLEELAPLEHVRTLNLRYAEYISDIGIAHLKNWRKLEYLNLRGSKVTSSVFEYVLNFDQLRYLDVAHSRVSDELFELLAELGKLETLACGGNKMSGAALPVLKTFPSLRVLDLGSSQRTDSGLWNVAITDENIQSVAQLTSLVSLSLSETALTDRSLAALGQLENLQELDISETRVTSQGLAYLQELPTLRHLKLNATEGIDDNAIKYVLRLKQLEVLELLHSAVTYEGASQLASHAGLKQLYLGGSDLTAQEISDLSSAMPRCHVSFWAAPVIARSQ